MNATDLRAALIAEIWSGDGLPSSGWTSTSADVSSPLSSNSSNLDQTDSYSMVMNDGGSAPEKTVAGYVFYPLTGNNRLVLWHNGHGTLLTTGGKQELINALVDEGYTVATANMPDTTSDNGSTGVAAHNTYTATASLNYLRFFIETPIRLINQLVSGYAKIYMAGVSGGGWTTHLTSAIDPRIEKSAPIAGSLPLFYKADSGSTRDWEQWLPRIFPALCDYHDLYVLACQPGRHQLHILNTEDTSVFPIRRFHERGINFERAVSAKAQEYGGSYELYWDINSEHSVSAASRARIIAFFGAE
jgi:hypothetical protein